MKGTFSKLKIMLTVIHIIDQEWHLLINVLCIRIYIMHMPLPNVWNVKVVGQHKFLPQVKL